MLAGRTLRALRGAPVAPSLDDQLAELIAANQLVGSPQLIGSP
jgi:hypothetical protein